MQTPEFTTSHSVLQLLDAAVREDGFVLTSAAADETMYLRSHAGWSTHIRFLVRTYEPECTCPYCQECEHETWYSLTFEVEMQQEGVDCSLRGSLEVGLEEALATYAARVRPLPDTIPLRIHRLVPGQINAQRDAWGDTPFYPTHVLQFVAVLRWQNGQLDASRECYDVLPSSNPARLATHREAIRQRIAELTNGVPFEERSTSTPWLPY